MIFFGGVVTHCSVVGKNEAGMLGIPSFWLYFHATGIELDFIFLVVELHVN